MKFSLLLIVTLLFMMACPQQGYTQVLTVPAAKKPEVKPPPPRVAPARPSKPRTTAIARIREEDDDDETTTKKEGANKFASVLFRANRGAGISVFINDTLIGKVKAGSSRRIFVDQDDYLAVKLSDGVGNVMDTTLYIMETDRGQLLTVQFPEYDYDGPRREALRMKREADSIALAERKLLAEADRQIRAEEARQAREAAEAERIRKAEEARLLREQADAEKAARIEEIRLQRIEAERIRKERLETYAKRLQGEVDNAAERLNGKLSEIESVWADVKSGKAEMAVLTAALQQYNEALDTYKTFKTEYADSLRNGGYEGELKTLMTAQMVNEQKYAQRLAVPQKWAERVNAGTLPMSADAETAFMSSRASDLKFFIPADSINAPFLKGKTPLEMAVQYKGDAAFFGTLITMGAELNNYGTRVPGKPNVYRTLLTQAVETGNREAVKVLAAKGARFYPEALPFKLQKQTAAHINEILEQNEQMAGLLKELGFNLDDGSPAIKKAMAEIAQSMVQVKGGSFVMGCAEGDRDCSGAEKPAHPVMLNSFQIAAFEVTQAQYYSILDTINLSEHKKCDDCPVENVTHNEVLNFIAVLNKYSGRNYRLPTEAEWEYAARAIPVVDSSNNWPYEVKSLDSIAWYDRNAVGQTHPVGKLQPNKLGLYDMQGNVAEWCADVYDEGYYSRSATENPKGPESGQYRTLRGGAFNQSNYSIRFSYRIKLPADQFQNRYGFRLAHD